MKAYVAKSPVICVCGRMSVFGRGVIQRFSKVKSQKWSAKGKKSFINISKIKFQMCVCDQLLSHDRLFCDPMDCSQPGSSVHGISQRAAISSSRGLLDPGIKLTSPVSPALGGGFLTCSLRAVPVTSHISWPFRTGSWMGMEVRKLKVDPTLTLTPQQAVHQPPSQELKSVCIRKEETVIR